MKIKIKDAKPFLREGDAFKTKSFPGDICTFLGCPCNLMSRRPGFDFTMYDDEEIDLLPPIRGRICDLFPYLKEGMKFKFTNEKETYWAIITKIEKNIFHFDHFMINHPTIPKFSTNQHKIAIHEIEIISEPEEQPKEEEVNVVIREMKPEEISGHTHEVSNMKPTNPIRIKLKDAKDILKPGMSFYFEEAPLEAEKWYCWSYFTDDKVRDMIICKKELLPVDSPLNKYTAFHKNCDKVIIILPEEKQQEATTEQPSTTETKCDHDYECTQCESFRCKKCGNVLVPIQMLLEIFNRLKKLGGV